MVALESTALSLAKTILQKAAGAWIADRRTAEVSKKELSALLTPRFRRAAPEQRFLEEAASDLASFGRYEFRGLDDGERAAALLAVGDAFERADLTDRALFAVDVDAAKLASRLRAGQPWAKTDAGLGEASGALYDAALDRCCELYVRAVVQVPTFVGRSSAEILNRLSDLPDQVAARVVDAWREYQAAVADPDGGVTVAGRPLDEVTDPFVLEVHRPVQPEDAPPGLPLLPPYMPREHDQVLGQVVRAAAGGRSGIAVLVGGSSTGKTRACWEALALLRDQDPPWRLWHPIDPSRPDAALAELPGIGPRTVVWLNEAQFYLDPAEAGLGERVAAGLRELLRDPGRAPVLVLATLWPGFWHALTARPADGEDRHAQARELLAGHDITVPAAFTPAQMGQLAQAADVRMVLAARSAPDGEVIQFLAGAPELLARYRNAPPAAAALISAAMDARRLGMGAGLPQAFLEAAAPGYLTDDQWDALGEDWLEQALAYTAVPCKGARGPLTRIRPRPARHAARNRGDQPGSMAAAAGPLYRLADYLDQHGRAHRASQIPPAEFWSAAAAHAAPGDQAALGDAAHARGLYRDAAQLHKNAAASGNPRAALYLSDPPACLRADPRPAHWAAAHAALDDPYGVASLLDSLREAGAHEQAAALLARDPAAHAALDDPARRGQPAGPPAGGGRARAGRRAGRPGPPPTPPRRPGRRGPPAGPPAGGGRARAGRRAGRPGRRPRPPRPPGDVARLLDSLREAGAHEQAATLLARDPAARAALDNPYNVALLLDRLREAGAASRPPRWPAGPPPTPPSTTRTAWPACWTACGRRARTSRPPRWPARAAAHAPLDDPAGVAMPAGQPAGGGRARAGRRAAGPRPAAHAPLDDPDGVARLLDSLREAGAHEQAAALLARDPAAHAPLDNPDGVAILLDRLREAGAHEQAAALAGRAAAHAPSTTRPAWPCCWTACGRRARTSRPPRWPAGPPPTPPSTTRTALPACWTSLREAGADEQAAALPARDPAANAPLDDPAGVALLLDRLRQAGAHEQAAALARPRPAAHAPSTTRTAWPACWTACGRRARTSRPPRCWPATRRPRRPRRPGPRGHTAGQPAGGGRARAGRRAGMSAAGGRHVRALPRAEQPRGSVPFRTGGRRHPGRAMGLGRPGLMACPRLAGTSGAAAALSGMPT